MEYGIKELSIMAGVSARTLRYYDEIGILKPLRSSESGYRYYGSKEVELLQQILFYKERGFRLDRISDIIYQKDFDAMSALFSHLSELQNQKQRIETLIQLVEKTIRSMKGEEIMSNQEKFEAFKQQIVDKNEMKFGKEAREKYGNEEVNEANHKMLHMTEEQYKRFVEVENEIKRCLKEAVNAYEKPESEAGKEIALLHKEWLSFTWKSYTVQAHTGLADMYAADERFRKYYDEEGEGCTQFLCDAIKFWIK